MLATLSEKDGGHIFAMFRMTENDWVEYDGMREGATCIPSKGFGQLAFVGWTIYVDLEYLRKNMKKLKREKDQLADKIPGTHWNETPKRYHKRT